MTYRVELQARYPGTFDSLARAIQYIRDSAGLWYELSSVDDAGVETLLVGRRDSYRQGSHTGDEQPVVKKVYTLEDPIPRSRLF